MEQDKDDHALDAFMHGQDALSRQLKQLKQPTAPAALTEAIFATIEAEMHRETAANDPGLPPSGNTARHKPHFFHRMRVPMALAASVLVGVIATMQWQRTDSGDVVVAQVTLPRANDIPGSTAAAPLEKDMAAAPSPDSAAAPEKPRPQMGSSRSSEPMPPMLAQNDAGGADDVIVKRAPLAMAPEASQATETPKSTPLQVDDPDHWLATIEKLYISGAPKQAYEEWRKFKAAFPHHPVKKKLAMDLDALAPTTATPEQ